MLRWIAIGLGVLLVVVVALALFGVIPAVFASNEATPVPTQEVAKSETTEFPPTEAVQPTPMPTPPAFQASVMSASLNYDESNNDPLSVGQNQLIALYLRLPAPIMQSDLENAISQIQQEAAAVNATVFEGSTLTLDQSVAWLVWCSDATFVDPPADVSLVHEITLLDSTTVGRVWVQVPFAEGVPLRSDDTWVGCNAFWAVLVH